MEVTRVVDHGFVHSSTSTTTTASPWRRRGGCAIPTGEVDYDDGELFGDTDPVPAVRELLESGELSWLPTTHLAGSAVEDPV